MANQRKPGKKKANFWLNKAELSLLDCLKEKMGVNKTDVIRELLILSTVQEGAYQLLKERDPELLARIKPLVDYIEQKKQSNSSSRTKTTEGSKNEK